MALVKPSESVDCGIGPGHYWDNEVKGYHERVVIGFSGQDRL